jgi:pimeloyl-ACP methyl ester carboxylesterase
MGGAADIPSWVLDTGVVRGAINAAGPNQTRVELTQGYGKSEAKLMEGIGHHLHMTRPELFNEQMLEAIADIVGLGS